MTRFMPGWIGLASGAALVASLAGSPARAQDQGLPFLVQAGAERIAALEVRTTLSDLDCSTDEIARFDGTGWTCAALPETSAPAVYEVSKEVTLLSDPNTEIVSFWDVLCDPGDPVLSGGFSLPGSASFDVVTSHAFDSPSGARGWLFGIRASAGAPILSKTPLTALCLDLGT